MKTQYSPFDGTILKVQFTELEQQVVKDLRGFDLKIPIDDAIRQLKLLYPELVPYTDNDSDNAFWDYIRGLR